MAFGSVVGSDYYVLVLLCSPMAPHNNTYSGRKRRVPQGVTSRKTINLLTVFKESPLLAETNKVCLGIPEAFYGRGSPLFF